MKLIWHYLSVCLLFFSCNDVACDIVPNTSFRVAVTDDFPTTGWKYADGGICGLIVYKSINGVIAYDRCSTIAAGSRSKVIVDGILIKDTESGAEWLLLDGSPSKTAECPLKTYRHIEMQGMVYYVSN